MMELCISTSLQVLDNCNWNDSKKYLKFMQQEGSNVVFLVSCLTSQKECVQTYFTKLELNPKEAIYSCICELLQIMPSKKRKHEKFDVDCCCLDSSCILDIKKTNYDIATRLFVSKALLNGIHGKTKDIIDMGLHRFFVLDDDINIDFIKNSKKLKSTTCQKIYFLTHIVLIASFYGKKKINGVITSIWSQTITTFKKWIEILAQKEALKENIEIWLELLVCLSMLHQKDFFALYKQKTDSIFKLVKWKRNGTNAHFFYHTNVLWAFYFAQIE